MNKLLLYNFPIFINYGIVLFATYDRKYIIDYHLYCEDK